MREQKSEIRDSDINQLLEKTAKRNYGQYLVSIKLKALRSFKEKQINFDFPVTALIGPNGGGKTTILGAAGILYKDVKPRQFFVKSKANAPSSMSDWKIEYSVVDKNEGAQNIIQKTASYGGHKWSRNAMSRPIRVFGISRTVPPTEKVEYFNYLSKSDATVGEHRSQLDANVADKVSRIIGKDVSKYSEIQIDKRGKVTLLTGVTASGEEYSEFHFGAGESSVIRMITLIESMPENSLILVEEIENGLHPIATKKMVEYLIDVAIRKKIQSIFTTHSNDALVPLPPKAIWAAVRGELYQGKLDINSLRAINGEVNAKLVVFCEDKFAKEWIESIIRWNASDKYELIEVYGMGGDSVAVSVHNNHNIDPTKSAPSICFIDGDSEKEHSDEKGIFRLPGSGPESYIYDKIKDKISEVKGELAVSLQMSYDKADLVEKSVNEIRLSNNDEHLLFNQMGEKLMFTSENIVRNAFLSIWNKHYKKEANIILNIILKAVPKDA